MKNWLVLFLLFIVIACSNKEDVNKLNFLKKGNTAYNNGDWSEAIRFYNEAIGLDSNFVDAWNNRGLAEMASNNYDDAIFSFNKALAVKANYTDAILNSARANLAVHQHYAALEQMDDLNKLWADSSIIYFTKGLIYYDMGSSEEAMNNFRMVHVRDSLNSEAIINMANIFYERKAYDSAVIYIKEALQIDADQPFAYNVLAMTYVGLNDYDQALKAINSAGSLNNNDPFIVNNKGYILLHMNRADEAESCFVKSMKIDPYNAYVYRNMGLLRYFQKDYTDAIRMLEKARTLDDNIDKLYFELAKAYEASGDNARACEMIKLSKVSDLNILINKYCL